ncbi:MAG: CBS domain-containing protein [Pseudomonadota bacterium]
MDKKQKRKHTTKKFPVQESVEVITTHINADFDALASLIAASKLYPGASLVFPGSQEKNLRNFFLHSTSYLFNFSKMKQIKFDRIKRLILVDTRQKNRIGKFAELVDRDDVEIHIYDHHPDSEDDIAGDMEIIRKTGSTTALLTSLIREKNIAISPDEATVMCLGIHEDTGSFTFSSTTGEDYEAAAWLTEQGANHNIIADMLTRELTTEQVWLLNDLTQSATKRVINGVEVVFAKVIRDEYVGDFAVLVHKFMEMENLNLVFALAQMESRIYLVARSRIKDVNVAEIAFALGGGGHPQAASATIKNRTLIQVERSLQALLRSRVDHKKRAMDMMSSPVLHISPGESVKKAANMMTRYNINVLLVLDGADVLKGYITRQVVEKAVFFGLGDIKVKEYMNIEFSAIGPDASLHEVQELIIRNKLRILPVLDNGKVLGVITRTDLLNILVGDPLIPEFLYDSIDTSQFMRKKNMSALLKERLPRKIISVLKDLGHVADMLGYNAYLVGGLVRDVFLKHENLDVDIVIEGDGIEFAHEFAEHYGARVRSHRKFGTAVLIFPDGFKVDVATARMEYYESPGAPPNVETSSLKLDLYRRDFTINTLAIKLNKRLYGTLIDYFGGQRDIKEKVLRVLHNLSFVEDPTRVLRAIRFEQRFGFKIGKLTLALIKNAVKINSFKDLSGRRLFLELKLILREPDPIKAIERMDELDLLQFVFPEVQLTRGVKGLLEEVRKVIVWYNLLYLEESFEPWKVYWHGLTSPLDKKTLSALADKMGMVGLENRTMLSQRLNANDLLDILYKFDGDNYHLYTLLHPYDTETLLYLMAKAGSEKVRRLISSYFTNLKGTAIQLKGKDLLKMGFSPGPFFKEIFDRLLEARLNDLVKTKEDEIRFVEETFEH